MIRKIRRRCRPGAARASSSSMFAVANREIVTVSFDPFNAVDPGVRAQGAAVRPGASSLVDRRRPRRRHRRLAAAGQVAARARAALEADVRGARAETETLRRGSSASAPRRRRTDARRRDRSSPPDRPAEIRRAHRHRRRHRPRADLSGADRRARATAFRADIDGAGAPSPHDPAGRPRRDAAADAGLDRAADAAASAFSAARSSAIFPDNAELRQAVAVRQLSPDVGRRPASRSP